MKRFIAGIMTVAMAATMAAFAFSSSAANDEVRGVIPRTKVDATLDAKDDEDFWANAYYEELNEENAFIKVAFAGNGTQTRRESEDRLF